MKIFAAIIVDVASQAMLPKPKVVQVRNRETGKPEFEKKYTYDQDSSARIDFPQWPVLESYFIEGMGKLRAEVAKLVISHIDDARANIVTDIHLTPVIYEKLDGYVKRAHVDKRIGYAMNENVEYKENFLQQFYFTIKIPFRANKIDTEMLVHNTFNNMIPVIKKELSSKGAI